MKQRHLGQQQSVAPGTEYARSIARYRPQKKRRTQASFLAHPWAPAIALALAAAGAVLLWSRAAHGDFREEYDGDVDFADFPPRRSAASAR